MPIPTMLHNYELDNSLIIEELNYDIEELIRIVNDRLPQLNVDQRAIFDDVVKAVKTYTSTIIFVDGRVPFVVNSMTNTIQLPEDIVLPSQELNDIIRYIYPNLSMQVNHQYLVERLILISKNDDVNTINLIAMKQFPGEAVELIYIDCQT
ncbi:5992_t:CDS:2 [Racocetra fulgida]|uniref:5992_t:CDS:1 n=1 Tax=Racocetra fulgida TaxID=60492 RepID=A0A9N8WTC9_9GLOM|nr:5992_t:CDS:2 [Racocetra fulgida]